MGRTSASTASCRADAHLGGGLRTIRVDNPTVVTEVNNGWWGGIPGRNSALRDTFPSSCQALAKLISRRGFSHRFRHNPDDLPLPVFHLLQRLNQRCDLTFSASKLA